MPLAFVDSAPFCQRTDARMGASVPGRSDDLGFSRGDHHVCGDAAGLDYLRDYCPRADLGSVRAGLRSHLTRQYPPERSGFVVEPIPFLRRIQDGFFRKMATGDRFEDTISSELCIGALDAHVRPGLCPVQRIWADTSGVPVMCRVVHRNRVKIMKPQYSSRFQTNPPARSWRASVTPWQEALFPVSESTRKRPLRRICPRNSAQAEFRMNSIGSVAEIRNQQVSGSSPEGGSIPTIAFEGRIAPIPSETEHDMPDVQVCQAFDIVPHSPGQRGVANDWR